MNWLARSLITAITAFAATNLDDLVILMLFFAQVNSRFRPRHIVIGQYLGLSVLVAASLPGFLGGLVIPAAWIGLLGFLPIAIGISQWFNAQPNEAVQIVASEMPSNNLARLLPAQTWQVALITIANGGDNIAIYIPLFASSDRATLAVILSGFFLLVGVWCGTAAQLASRAAIVPVLARYGRAIVPFMLIGLGVYILLESVTESVRPPR